MHTKNYKRLIQQVIKSITATIVFLLITIPCFATNSIDDLVFTSQKYVVVTAVVLVIFSGISIYLFTLERKIKKIEDKQNKTH